MFALVTPLVFTLPLIWATPILPTSLKNGLFAGSDEDFIQKTTRMTESTVTILRSLSRDPIATEYIDRIISDKNNVCLTSLDDAIAGIEMTTKLVENNQEELNALIDESNKFLDIEDPAVSLRQSATLLKILGPLSEKLLPEITCQASPGQATGALEELTIILHEVAALPALGLRNNVRAALRVTGDTIHAANTFLNDVRRRFEKLSKLCTGDRTYSIEAVNAFGDLMSDLADLLRETGAVFTSDRVRQGKLFTYKIGVQLRKIELENLITAERDHMECSSLGDFSLAASNLEDLAGILEEVDLEELQKQLGIDLGEIY